MALNRNDQRRVMEFEAAEHARAAWRLKMKTHGIMAVAAMGGLGAMVLDGNIAKVACLCVGVMTVCSMAVKEPNDKKS